MCCFIALLLLFLLLFKYGLWETSSNWLRSSFDMIQSNMERWKTRINSGVGGVGINSELGVHMRVYKQAYIQA